MLSFIQKNPNEPNYVHEGRGSETTSYLKHIIDNYDTLSEWTLFVHGHEFHWHHPMSVLKTCEIDLNKLKDDCKFLPVNHGRWGLQNKYGEHEFANKTLPIMVYKPSAFTPSDLSKEEYCQVMQDILGIDEFNAIKTKYFTTNNSLCKHSYTPCAKFYLHKDHLCQRPKSFYEHCSQLYSAKDYLLRQFAATDSYPEHQQD